MSINIWHTNWVHGSLDKASYIDVKFENSANYLWNQGIEQLTFCVTIKIDYEETSELNWIEYS